MLVEDALDGLRLTTAWRSAGIPGNLALRTFLGKALVEVEGSASGAADPSSESLPTAGRLEDVTEVSEFRRGRVV
jgi:hypothetical protein